MRKVVAVLVAVVAGAVWHGVRAEGTLVGLDVIVSDAAGQSVANLQSTDLTVTVDGAPVAVKRVERGAERGPQVYGIFLDEYHVAGADAARVRAALTQFVEHDLRPGDRGVVLKPLDSLVSISLTDDRGALVKAIASFTGRRGDYTPHSSFEEQFVARSPAIADRTRARMSWSATSALAQFLAGVGDGRKTLVIVSEGIELGTGRRRGVGPEGPGTIARRANGGNVAIYSIDPAPAETPPQHGPSASADADSFLMLGQLAGETGGRAIGSDDLEAGLQAMAADARGYYWLQWEPADEGDGRFHAVTVTGASNVSVRTRPGYWARSAAADRIIAATAAPPLSMPLVETAHSSLLIRPWFGFSRGDAGKTRVTFVWEPAPKVPGDPSRRPAASQVVFEALDADGSTIFQATVPPSGGAGEEEAEPPARAVFDVPPGRLRLKLSIEGGAEELDRDVRSIGVRKMSGAVVLGSPEVFRTRTARDWRLLDADPNAAPVAAREFSRAERIAIRFAVYADGTVSRSAVLKGPDGRVLRKLEVAAVAAKPDWFQTDLPLASLANGAYSIEIAAAGPAGEAKDLVSFRVTN